MADARRVARQWVATDEAFGVGEVPVRRRGRAAAKAPSPPVRQVQNAAPVRPAAAARPVAASPARAAPVPAIKTPAKIVMPVTPAGLISALPALRREEKIAALDALQQQAQRESAAFISDICTRLVFGEGDPDAPIFFVGEGPGAEEDRTGRPFVGRCGHLLDKMIGAMGFKREQVYIGNVVKLRCAEWNDGADGAAGGRLADRPPNPEEVARGIPYLHRQIEIVRPRVIVTLGVPAVKHLVGMTEGIMRVRGKWLVYRGISVMPTYHPSFVLRVYTEKNRRDVWNDLKEAAERAKGEG